MLANKRVKTRDIVPEIIESGPLRITDLFQNKSVVELVSVSYF